MLFCSQAFVVFFALVFALYWGMPWQRARVWLLLIASYYFYASWNHWLALLIFATTIVDYLVALGMNATEAPIKRRLLLLGSLAANLGMLGVFKYANFFLGSLQSALEAAGMSASLPLLSVILPIGISFYTFEAINYTVDVYRGRMKAERNLAHFLLFILFFPHLIAGPIVRAADFLPQVRRAKRWSWVRAQVGAQLFLLGVVKKLAIADRMALFVDPVFQDPGSFSTYTTWGAILAYALQLYCDFSGYSDMAIGAAHLLGYKLARNFNMPFLSASFAEFWRRWHMSLSSWIRDYVFIPLGGSRGGRWQTCRNLMITMTLCGLWHGAGWNYIAFGALHGLFLVIYRLGQEARREAPWLAWLTRGLDTAPGHVLCVATTFLTFAVSLIVFRTTTFTAAGTMLQHLFVRTEGLRMPLHSNGLWYTLALVAVAHLVGHFGVWRRLQERVPAPVLGGAYAFALSLALLFATDDGKAFIYFQF
jgi:alginate O-acetyltransferase complex protein AlgI